MRFEVKAMKKTVRADEMELSINFRAIRVSWVLTAVFLLIWNIVLLIRDGTTSTIPFVLMNLHVCSMFATKVILSNRMGRNDDAAE